jgi:hypothetical protein
MLRPRTGGDPIRALYDTMPRMQWDRKAKQLTKTMTPIQDRLFLAALAQAGIPAPVAEFRFHPVRKWRFDFCWPDQRLALEIQGGVFSNGRHSRGAAMIKEWEKLNTAAGMGYRLLYCQPSDCTKIETINAIKAALNQTI